MKFLVIGCLGSMGRRRIQCIDMLGYNGISTRICGYDSQNGYSFDYFLKYEDVNHDAMFVCSPPLTKQPYIDFANKYNIPCFCEIDMMQYEGNYYPSCTFLFNDSINRIRGYVEKNKVLTFQYHAGQNLYDWKNGDVNFFAAKDKTGGCKEIMAVEFPWLETVFGKCQQAVGIKDKQLDDGNIDAYDVFSMACQFGNISGTITFDIVSRPSIRKINIVTKDDGIKTFDIVPDFDMYLNETKHFIDAALGKSLYCYDKSELDVLYKIFGTMEGK